jgi:hypothetical protein
VKCVLVREQPPTNPSVPASPGTSGVCFFKNATNVSTTAGSSVPKKEISSSNMERMAGEYRRQADFQDSQQAQER